MFDELSTILRDRVSPEVLSGMAELTQALEKHQAVMYKDRINQLMMDGNNKEQITLADEAIAIVFGQVNALLQQMHLTLDVDNIQLSKLARILDALLFTPSDDDQQIADIIEQSSDSVDAFCEILALRLNAEPEEYMDVVLSVPEETITTISEVITKNLSYQDNAVDGVEDIVKLMNRHQGLIGDAVTVGMESLQASSEVVGIDPETLIEQKKELLLQAEPKDLVDQLMSIVILSGIELDELQAEVMTYVESIVHDPLTIQKAYKHLVSRMAALRSETK